MLNNGKELTAPEYRALNMIVSVTDPAACPAELPETLWKKLDGRHDLLSCIRIADSGTSPETVGKYVDILRQLATSGAVKIVPAVVTTSAEFASGLQKLGVKKGMQMVVHSTFSAFGSVPEGAESFCRKLQ